MVVEHFETCTNMAGYGAVSTLSPKPACSHSSLSGEFADIIAVRDNCLRSLRVRIQYPSNIQTKTEVGAGHMYPGILVVD